MAKTSLEIFVRNRFVMAMVMVIVTAMMMFDTAVSVSCIAGPEQQTRWS